MLKVAGVVAGGLLGLKVVVDIYKLKYPKKYVEIKTQEECRETRPLDDVLIHLLLFKYRLFGDGALFQKVLYRINENFLSWDTEFEKLGQDGEQEILNYCVKWGIPLGAKWEWSKKASEFRTMNEWFSRRFAVEYSPEKNLGCADIVTPATAVVMWFEKTALLPKLVKNESFVVDDVLPHAGRYLSNPCAILYLAPSDYHCFHSPISGKVVHFEFCSMETFSVTVKPYIFQEVNILKRNRRCVVVVENEKLDLAVCLVIIGGVTVDSIRMIENPLGKIVEKGQYLGAFARGGSSIALFFSRPVDLLEEYESVLRGGFDFKLRAGNSLCTV